MKAVTYLNEFANSKVQRVSTEQLHLHRDVIKLEKGIFEAMEMKKYWNRDNDDSGKILSNSQRYC